MCRILKTSNQNTICHNHLNMKRIYRKQATNNACSDWLRKRISRGCEIDWVRIDSLLTPLNDSSILEYRLGVDDYLNNRHALNWKRKIGVRRENWKAECQHHIPRPLWYSLLNGIIKTRFILQFLEKYIQNQNCHAVTNCHAFHKTTIIQQVTMLKHVFSHCHELSRIVTLSCFHVFSRETALGKPQNLHIVSFATITP